MKNQNNLPKLRKIELLLEANDGRIKLHTFYLAKIDIRDEASKQFKKSGRGFIGWYAGTFTKQWYGWNFNTVYSAGFQYNYPGWKELYEIEDKEIDEDTRGWAKTISRIQEGS